MADFGPDFQLETERQSYACEAAEATLRWIAANRPRRPVWAITWAGNTRSRGLMQRLGMRYLADMDFEHPTAPAELKATVTYRLEAAHVAQCG